MLLNSKETVRAYDELYISPLELITDKHVLTFLTEFFKRHGISTMSSSDSVVLDLLVSSDDQTLALTTTASFKELLLQELTAWLMNLGFPVQRTSPLLSHQVLSVKSWTRLRAYTNHWVNT